MIRIRSRFMVQYSTRDATNNKTMRGMLHQGNSHSACYRPA